jgi:hypothetical protein
MKVFAINEAVANEILQYLTKQPYGEVVGMINRLMQLQEVSVKPELVPGKQKEE